MNSKLQCIQRANDQRAAGGVDAIAYAAVRSEERAAGGRHGRHLESMTSHHISAPSIDA